LIRRVAEAVGVASAILVGGSSNAVDLCDSHTRKKQRGRPRAYRRRSLNVWVAGCASGRVTRGNALFHGQVPNEAAQLLVRWLIGVGWAGRTLRRVRPCPIDRRVSGLDSQSIEGRCADGDGG
jgi:hypothetical protein